MINEELNKKRGQRLKECRELRKITQNELAMLSHCSPQSISYIENGRRGMSRDLAHIFAKELKIKEEYILLESDFKTDSEKVKHEDDIMNAIDNSAFKYLTSLGYKILLLKMKHYYTSRMMFSKSRVKTTEMIYFFQRTEHKY